MSVLTRTSHRPAARIRRPCPRLDWLIVGGGVHGLHIAHALTRRHGVDPARLRIVDPAQEPLARWHAVTRAVGMEYLRSPVVHHVGLGPMDLQHFGRARPEAFLGRYNRPSLRLFGEHAEAVYHRNRMHRCWLRAGVSGLRRRGGAWRAETDRGCVDATRVVLAIGAGPPVVPPWARDAARRGGRVFHVLDPAFRRERVPAGHVAVVGGGISAAQVALALSATHRVTLVMRHCIREAEFDSPPGWLGPARMGRFGRLPDPAARRGEITMARNRGSMPEDVSRRLRAAFHHGRVTRVEDHVLMAEPAGDGLRLALRGGGALDCEVVVLATGVCGDRPGGAWLDRAVTDLGLPVAGCGYPLVDGSLAWAPGLHVSGGLAELEIGPVARNIAGAQRAADRIGAATG